MHTPRMLRSLIQAEGNEAEKKPEETNQKNKEKEKEEGKHHTTNVKSNW